MSVEDKCIFNSFPKLVFVCFVMNFLFLLLLRKAPRLLTRHNLINEKAIHSFPPAMQQTSLSILMQFYLLSNQSQYSCVTGSSLDFTNSQFAAWGATLS